MTTRTILQRRYLLFLVIPLLLFCVMAMPKQAMAAYEEEWFEYADPNGSLEAAVAADLEAPPFNQSGAYDYTVVTKLKVSGTLTSADYAFMRSKFVNSLREVDVSGVAGQVPNRTFMGYSALAKVRISDTQVVGQMTFANCSSLKTLTCGSEPFTEGVIDLRGYKAASFGDSAFVNCGAEKIHLGKNSPSSSSLFSRCLSLRTLVCGDGAFTEGVIDLSAYEADSFGASLFSSCEFDTVRLPASTPLSEGMFGSCPNLRTVVCGNGSFTKDVIDLSGYEADSFGDSAFINAKIDRVRLPLQVPISTYMFSGCTDLKTLVCGAAEFSEGVIDLGGYRAATFGEEVFQASGVMKVRLPVSVEISNGMFMNCRSLKTLVCGDDPFIEGTVDLSGYKGSAYGTGVFYRTYIEKVRLSSSIALSNTLFSRCSALDTLVFIGGTSAPTVDPNAFAGTPNTGTLYYPQQATGYEVGGVFATTPIDDWARQATTAFAITTHPVDVEVTVGGATTFAVKVANAVEPSYQWQVSTDGLSWHPLTNEGIYSGATTATLTLSNVALEHNAQKYRCVVSSFTQGTMASNAATLTVKQAPEPGTPKLVRLAGTDRYKTMTAILEQGFADRSATTVIIATGENYPDALAAAGLAGLKNAPILLTAKEALTQETAEEIERLGVKKALIIGSTAALAQPVETSLKALGVSTTRIQGLTRVETAVAIFRQGLKESNTWSTTAIVASGSGFADALSISSYSYANAAPIFLTSGDKTLSADTLSAIKSGKFKRILIVGSDAVVSSQVEHQLKGHIIKRLAGPDRYATSVKIAEFATADTQAIAKLSVDGMAFATGANFPDALSGAAFCGKNKGIILLVADNPVAKGYIDDFMSAAASPTKDAYVLGSESVVSSELFTFIKSKGFS